MSSLTNRVSSSSSKTSKLSKIEKIVFGGSGLTRLDGCVIFVPFSAPGDEVTLKILRTKKSYKIARIETLHKPGKERVAPLCPHFQQCGGCQLQHLSYKGQLEAKRSFVEDSIDMPVEVVPAPSPWHYRSHLRFNLRKRGEGFQYGFIGVDNHSLIEVKQCPLFLERSPLFSELRSYLASLSNQGIKSASLRVFKNEGDFVLAFSFFPKLPKELPPFSLAKGVAFKCPGREIHHGNTELKREILGLTVPFSPYGFMQNNLAMSEQLYQTTLNWIGPRPKRVLDLYCGVGVTSTLLSKMGHDVIGVESNREALKGARGARFICGSVEQELPELQKSFRPDLILINPPRTGLSKEVRSTIDAPELLYISCMPSTLKRDLEELKKRYHVTKALAFDMFPQTTHVETLIQLKAPTLR
ncbi:MAG: 23S rRNA (uracil(1939)-C(5))-methyltransferase RlmD [Chlamydiae bacterium]|nr:23S rRNA (uracil(1939)-C(5))-methyltransferase RlmD [Chlamydiota bacterium]